VLPSSITASLSIRTTSTHTFAHRHIPTQTNSKITAIMNFTFECGICLEEKVEQRENVHTVGVDCICSGCALEDVVPLFKAALQNEIHFPPRFGPIELSLEAFADLFTDDFHLAYTKKMKEYKTPIPNRLYCQHKVHSTGERKEGESDVEFCNTFMGSAEGKGVSQCHSCTNWMCLECRGTACSPPEIHTCDNTKTDTAEVLDKDTKACPVCTIKIAQRDGCNAMDCICGVTFCFICGQEAHHDSQHWVVGNPCPRWGTVDAPNPMFDMPAPVRPQVLNPEDLLFALIQPAVGQDLFMDLEEVHTLIDEFDAEKHMHGDEEKDFLPPVLLEILELLRDLRHNMMWITTDLLLAGNPELRAHIFDPVRNAVETTNFFIRDERLADRFLATLQAALEVTGEDTVLFEMPTRDIFNRYTEIHRVGFMDAFRMAERERDAGR
jgi:hypothetical protein